MSAIKKKQLKEVSRHSVDMYIERVLEMDKRIAGQELRQYCISNIIDAVTDPDIIYNEEEDEGGTPIHIKGEIAVPVKRAEENPDKVVVPTTYQKETFV